MALALLDLVAVEAGRVRFRIDTGINEYYRIKIGRGVQRRQGIDWVDDVSFVSPLTGNTAAGDLLSSAKEISVPAARFGNGSAYVQLFTFKTPQGTAPAFSSIVRMPVGPSGPVDATVDLAASVSEPAAMSVAGEFAPARRVACTESFVRAASLEDLLAGIVKAVAPAIAPLISGSQHDSRPAAPGGGAGTNGGGGTAEILALLLQTILGKLPGASASGVSRTQSLTAPRPGNRFLSMQTEFSQPFIFGIDDALLGSMIGPLAQMLPQLMNSANQRRVQMKQADNKLISDLVSDVERRMLLERLVDAQRQAPPAGQSPDLEQLIQLLQSASDTPAAAASPAAPPAAAPATTKSLSLNGADTSTASSRCVVSLVTADPVRWNGTQKVVFSRNQTVQLKVRLGVADPVPTRPLPKAIIRIVFKNGVDQAVWYEKTFKQKNVLPNSVASYAFTADELARVPANEPVVLLVEMRWPSSKGGSDHKAVGSAEIVLVNKYFLKEQGQSLPAEQELTDLGRFKPFWNNVWQAPLLDAASGGDGRKKYLWELDVDAKYSVLLVTDRDTNGVMDTKLRKAPPDEDSLTERTQGRMKGGIELSLAEVNKLLPLWSGHAALEPDKLDALRTRAFAAANAGELVSNLKLRGRAGERGMIWIIPTFKLFELTLNTPQRTDDAGQVLAVGEETVQFPLPVAARVIGLKSQA